MYDGYYIITNSICIHELLEHLFQSLEWLYRN